MVHIITDNAANLPKALQEQYGIEELCLTYTVDGVPADTSVEFDGRGFYDALRRGASVQTSMVTPDAAQKGMEPYLINGEDVLYVGLSSGVSGTCWGVGLVARELAEKYPERKIRVLDTRGASLGEGLIVLAAAKLAAEGRVIEEIVVRCEELCGKMRQHFMVDDLKFLRKGGRISGSAALAGTLLQIKPILQGDEEARSSSSPRCGAGRPVWRSWWRSTTRWWRTGVHRWASPTRALRPMRCTLPRGCGRWAAPARS